MRQRETHYRIKEKRRKNQIENKIEKRKTEERKGRLVDIMGHTQANMHAFVQLFLADLQSFKYRCNEHTEYFDLSISVGRPF